MILLFHNFLHFAKLLNKKYGTHTESRILHLHKIFYSAYPEEKYLIYLLFHHGVYLNTDCETGVLYILNK